MKEDILFLSHLGLGDQIACNGIVHYLAEENPNRKIFVATSEHNLHNVEFLYKDFKHIEPLEIVERNPKSGEELAEANNLKLIQTSIQDKKNRQHWDEDHFTNLNLNYEIKFKYSKLPTITNEREILKKATQGHEKFAFVHDGPESGHRFTYKTELFVVKNQKSLNVFEMAPILKHATELHMMGSSLVCLAEVLQLPLSHQKAYFYPFRRGEIKLYNNKEWTRL